MAEVPFIRLRILVSGKAFIALTLPTFPSGAISNAFFYWVAPFWEGLDDLEIIVEET